MTRFRQRACLKKAGLLRNLLYACPVMRRVTKQAFPSSLPMTRPREPETGDSLTDSAEESQVRAAPGSRESARVNAEQRHFTTCQGTSELKLQVCYEQLFSVPLCVISCQKPSHPGFITAKLFTRAYERPSGLELKNEAADRVRDFSREGGWVTSNTRPVGTYVHASRWPECEGETHLGVPGNILAGQFRRGRLPQC